MKRLIAASLAALSILAFTGCSSDSPVPTVTVTAGPSAPVAPVVPEPPLSPVNPTDEEEEFLYDLSQYVDIPANQEEDAILLGRTICSALDAGASKPEIAEVIVDSGFTVDESVAFVAAATVNFCPEHTESAKNGV